VSGHEMGNMHLPPLVRLSWLRGGMAVSRATAWVLVGASGAGTAQRRRDGSWGMSLGRTGE